MNGEQSKRLRRAARRIADATGIDYSLAYKELKRLFKAANSHGTDT